MVRGMKVEEALDTLSHLPKKGARHLHKVIHSAASNAENNDKQQRKDLYIKELIVNKGPAFRRYIPMARGRARGIDKWTSHVTVRLGVEMPEEEKGKGKREKGQGKESAPLRGREKKKPLKAEEVSGPVAAAPGNPAKASEDESGDPHAGGSNEKQGGATFTQHRQGGRGE